MTPFSFCHQYVRVVTDLPDGPGKPLLELYRRMEVYENTHLHSILPYPLGVGGGLGSTLVLGTAINAEDEWMSTLIDNNDVKHVI